jgi:ElaB/YqjD/DUF883 family membrane-anchored ribosome-binding protein
MGYKMKGFSGFGNESPVKQKAPKAPKAKTKMATDWNLENKKTQNIKLKKVSKKSTSTLSRITKAFKNTSKQLAKPGVRNLIKTVKTVSKNPLTPIGIGTIVGEAIAPYTKKVAKATKKGLKKKAKSGNVNIGRKL